MSKELNIEEKLLATELTEDEAKELYDEDNSDIMVGPTTHNLDEAIAGTLEEDKDVIFNEIS